MVPPSTNTVSDKEPEILDALPVMAGWVRVLLVSLAIGFGTVLTIAVLLNPYNGDGSAKRMETHRELGLPPCTFYDKTKLPCPSCGMTTSFALLMHGDVLNSLRANWTGTFLALACLIYIPWSLASVWVGRTLYVQSMERLLLILIVGFMACLLLRWLVVVTLRLTGWW
jgi:hypothetical protein